MKMHGYHGYFGIDVNPERMPVATALRNSMDAIRAANERIELVDHEAVLHAHQHPEKTRGWVEAHLIRLRAPATASLPPLARPL